MVLSKLGFLNRTRIAGPEKGKILSQFIYLLFSISFIKQANTVYIHSQGTA